MGEFLTPVDIGNRGLDHTGTPPMGASGFSENSKKAGLVSRVYGKLRRAELRRNVWTFATRKAALRPIDTNTLLLVPSLWSSSVTYFRGSIVQDANATPWISRIRDNLNNQPGISWASWEPYFGPLTVMLYDSSLGYLDGELVYTTAGDGTFNTFQSTTNVNAVHPAIPNQWSVNGEYQKDDVVQQFPAWAVGTTYAAGASVLYTDGNVYSSLVAGNVGNIPSASGSVKWVAMPVLTLLPTNVPLTTFQQPLPSQTTPIDEWQQGTTYALGSFAIFNAAVYVSILASNTGNFPNAAASTFWKATTGGTLYMSLIDGSRGNSPANAPALWASGTTYGAAATVGGSDGLIYTSIAGGNLAHNPTTDGGVHWTAGGYNPWTTVFTLGGGNSQWLQVGGALFPNGVGLTALNIRYPLNCGPASQTWTRNAYMLPAGFLRLAPQDPKSGAVPWLGGPSGNVFRDWTIEGAYIVTSDIGVITFRFVADVQDVGGSGTGRPFDDMFCEGLAARIAVEVCEPLTQSGAKIQTIASAYKLFMTEARTQNFIEAGFEESPDDEYLTVRY